MTYMISQAVLGGVILILYIVETISAKKKCLYGPHLLNVTSYFELAFIIGLALMFINVTFNTIIQFFLRQKTEEVAKEKSKDWQGTVKTLMFVSFILEWTMRFLVLGLSLYEIIFLFSPGAHTCTSIQPAPLQAQGKMLLVIILL